jgi:hypothetical protein
LDQKPHQKTRLRAAGQEIKRHLKQIRGLNRGGARPALILIFQTPPTAKTKQKILNSTVTTSFHNGKTRETMWGIELPRKASYCGQTVFEL